MTKEYDHITAFHYSAYRPPLHKNILARCLGKNEAYNLGLDVGCGTGQSSIALIDHCKKVFGIEPSKDMLVKSIRHPQTEYILYDCNNIAFENDYFDIITFAGSLFYAKSQKLLDEVIRVSKCPAKIIVYDFEVLLDPILEKLNIHFSSNQKSYYNHQENFSGLIQKNLRMKDELKMSTSFDIVNSNLVHLLLSSKENYCLLHDKFGGENLYNEILQKLNTLLISENSNMEAIAYSTIYEIVK